MHKVVRCDLQVVNADTLCSGQWIGSYSVNILFSPVASGSFLITYSFVEEISLCFVVVAASPMVMF